MAKYVKPNGTEIEINGDNEDAVKYVEGLGWKKARKKRVPKKEAE